MCEDDTPEKPISLYTDLEGMRVLLISFLKDGIGEYKPFMKG